MMVIKRTLLSLVQRVTTIEMSYKSFVAMRSIMKEIEPGDTLDVDYEGGKLVFNIKDES